MVSAAEIAQKLGCKQVTINYRATEFLAEYFNVGIYLIKYFSENPMPDLEFIKSGCDFKGMIRSNPALQALFPESVEFREARDFKVEILEAYPENYKRGQ